jgi:hypothetical protein
MPLGPWMLDSVVTIIGDVKNETTGRFVRKPIGTGFLIQVASETWDGHYTYVVTADHVIDGQSPDLVFPVILPSDEIWNALMSDALVARRRLLDSEEPRPLT